jgi:hypothetical protein
MARKETITINDLVDTHCEDEFVYGVIVGELHKAEAFLLSCKETRSSMNAFNATVGKDRFISIKKYRLRTYGRKLTGSLKNPY